MYKCNKVVIQRIIQCQWINSFNGDTSQSGRSVGMSSARTVSAQTGHVNSVKDEQFSVVAAVEVLCDQECCLPSSSPDMTSSLRTVCMWPAGSDGSGEGTACGGGRAAAAQSHGLLVLQRRLWDHRWWRWWGGGSGHRRRVDVRPRGLTRRRVGLSGICSISRDSLLRMLVLYWIFKE